jgi:hypothetical protein
LAFLISDRPPEVGARRYRSVLCAGVEVEIGEGVTPSWRRRSFGPLLVDVASFARNGGAEFDALREALGEGVRSVGPSNSENDTFDNSVSTGLLRCVWKGALRIMSTPASRVTEWTLPVVTQAPIE